MQRSSLLRAGAVLAGESDFVRFALGAKRLYLNRVLAPHAAAIAAALSALKDGDRIGAGARRSAFRLALAGAPELIARCARRGGLVQLVLSDLYFGISPRPVRELAVTLEARRRGVALAEPMGAMVQWLAPMVYRGFFLTRALPGMTLWEFIRTDHEPALRAQVLASARFAIQTTAQRGLFHADLNLHNLFVTRIGSSPAVVILDLDKARLYPAPLAPRLVETMRMRLARSARKLDPVGRYLDGYALSRLNLI